MPTDTITASPDTLAAVDRLIRHAEADGVRIPDGVTRFDVAAMHELAHQLVETGSCLIDWSPGDMTRYVIAVVDMKANILGGHYAVSYLSRETSVAIELGYLGDFHSARRYLTENVASAYVLAIYFTLLADAVNQIRGVA